MTDDLATDNRLLTLAPGANIAVLIALGAGGRTASETLGHVEFVLTYKPAAANPGCHPN
ncbi:MULTISPECIES: hypothetical protein [unclassified Mameliella]|uniref:hypothetical protein n=1 Tax=unclassified Mameliella TaxID=2630630 RepID=UPI00273DFAB5|nr:MULTISPECIES: hypothetical protein [unclassified Mameliella]